MRILLGDQLVTRIGQGPKRDFVRHGRGRDEDGLFLTKQLSDPPFELEDRRVLAPLFVPDLGIRHRVAHAAARLRFRV